MCRTRNRSRGETSRERTLTLAVGATMEVMVTADMMLVCERFGVFVPGVLSSTEHAVARVKLQIKNHNGAEASCRVDRPNRFLTEAP